MEGGGLCRTEGRRACKPQSWCWTLEGSQLIGVRPPEREAPQGGHWEEAPGPGGPGARWRVSRGGDSGEATRRGAEDDTQGLLGGGKRALLRGPPTPPCFAELVCNRTFDKYSCWPDTPPNTTANISCPWYLPWHHKGNCGKREGKRGLAEGARAGGRALTGARPSSAAPPRLQEVRA